MNQRFLYFVTFIGFTVIVASKDIVSRFLLVQGIPVAHLLLFAGGTAFFIALFQALTRGTSLHVNSYRYQTVRLLLDGAAWAFATQAFKLLNATSISIISKAYIPLLILIGPLLGNVFSRKQYFFASSAFLAMVAFAFFSRAPNESLLGYLFLLLSTLTVAASYIMLRHSTIKESPFVVVATPALACVMVGAVWGLQLEMPLAATGPEFALEAICGLLIFGLYTASIYRYRLLPVGLAEYPTLLTAFLILPAEYFLFGWFPSVLYLANISLVLFLVGYCVYLDLARKQGSPSE